MSPRSYPVPGEILNSADFFGLSYDQILMIGLLPIIVMMFSIIVGFIPMWVSLLLGLLSFIAVGIVVAKAPDGQDPFTWAAAAFKRHFTSSRYTLQPTSRGRSDPVIVDTIHTSDSPGDFSPDVAAKLNDDNSENQPTTNTTETFVSDNE